MNKRLRNKAAALLGHSGKRSRGRPARVDSDAVVQDYLLRRLPVNRVAREYGITRRHVYRICKKARQAAGPMGDTLRRLFGGNPAT